MKTLTFKVEDGLANWLEKEAKASRRSKSQVVREALEARMKRFEGKSCYDLSADLCGSLKGPRDLSYGKRHMKGFGES